MRIFLTAMLCAATALPQITALDFPGTNDANRSFRRTQQQGLPNPYPMTVIWQAYVLHKSPEFYQTCWFYGGRNFYASVDKYYGCCPYPSPSPNGPIRWEIASDGGDLVGDLIEAGRWYTCVFTAWKDGSGTHHRFYFDVPNTSKLISEDLRTGYFSSVGSDHEICWGDAQWDHVRSDPPSFGGKECLKGRMRRFKIITAPLSLPEILQEAQSDELATIAAQNNIWYYNANPGPDDLQDKSGKGHHFSWYDSNAKSGLWTGASTSAEILTPAATPDEITLWPNPLTASATLMLRSLLPAGTARISLFNSQGIRVDQWTASAAELAAGIRWNAAHRPSGFYVIEMESDFRRLREKVILRK